MIAELDCRGIPCPEPVIRCRALLDAEKPEHICVLLDNVAAVENVSRFCEGRGYTVAAVEETDILWRLNVMRDGAMAPQESIVVEQSVTRQGKTLVFISTETLGRGDDALGTKLMANFLATLPELGDKLWRIILVNGGVRLAAMQGKALESLHMLETNGVEIFVCGTCLDFYGLMEQKEVGQTTNMLDIVTSFALADTVIRP